MATAVHIRPHGDHLMPPPTRSAEWYQKQLLERISEVDKKVEQSLQLSRENGEGIRQLRVELGVDGAHGRIPQIEAAIARLDRCQEDDRKTLSARVDRLEDMGHFQRGKHWVVTTIIAVLSSGGAVAVFEFLVKKPH